MGNAAKRHEMLIQGQHVAEPTLRFSTHWNLLGPFQIGTRGKSVNDALAIYG